MNNLPEKADKLTPKEVLFLKYYTDVKNKETYGNGTISAMKTWPDQTYDSACTSGSRTLGKAKVTLKHLFEQKGLSTGRLVNKIDEWIDAKKISTSLTEPDRETNDYQTQLKAGEMLTKLLGLDSSQQANIQVNILNNLQKDKEEFGI